MEVLAELSDNARMARPAKGRFVGFQQPLWIGLSHINVRHKRVRTGDGSRSSGLLDYRGIVNGMARRTPDARPCMLRAAPVRFRHYVLVTAQARLGLVFARCLGVPEDIIGDLSFIVHMIHVRLARTMAGFTALLGHRSMRISNE